MPDALERKLYVIRKTASSAIQALKLTHSREYYVPSMDCGTPFCNSGCPVNNIIPDFNDLVYRAEMALQGVELPPPGEYGVGIVWVSTWPITSRMSQSDEAVQLMSLPFDGSHFFFSTCMR